MDEEETIPLAEADRPKEPSALRQIGCLLLIAAFVVAFALSAWLGSKLFWSYWLG